MAQASGRALFELVKRSPVNAGGGRGTDGLASLQTAAADLDTANLLAKQEIADLITGVMDGSPYLSQLMLRDPARLLGLFSSAPDERLKQLCQGARLAGEQCAQMPDLMAALRAAKTEASLLIALADIGGAWPLADVTNALSEIADATLDGALRFLFRQAQQKGEWTDPTAAPEATSGLIVLGMGKYGARELNYSSDIDLIIFFDPERAALKEGLEPQAFFVRMTRDLVKIMQERTGEGYVFRTDLRLRPDAGATQVALSRTAALYYYESFGQNWERAAMIKARPVAGDITAGAELIEELSPFIWRKYLDFAAIADVHAMKRQIHAHRGFEVVGVAGHNIKVGRGGIREIEFFAQTQQLIAGGRQTELRAKQTLEALARLTERGWIEAATRDVLSEAYVFLRTIEHRLQMVADEQTHVLPADSETLQAFARFAGYDSTEALSTALLGVLGNVQAQYAALFEDIPELTSGGTNMVFAGEDDDPGTLEALARLGYSNPVQAVATVRSWHRGRYAAVRSARTRERLTEVQPKLIEALADTADPDAALIGFDRFLSKLPTGVQLFSLLRANPNLLRLVADIVGSAPRLARILGRRPRVLDAVLDPRVIGLLPKPDELQDLLNDELNAAEDFQDRLDRARVVCHEQAFLIGVRLLSGIVEAEQAGGAFTLLAEQIVAAMHAAVSEEFSSLHGDVDGGGTVVLALGKLGGREMTAASDLDLIVVYDAEDQAQQSNGPKALPVSQYYSRLTHRLISALSAPTAEGVLYEVDMRLRPSGQQGPVATRLASFINYQQNDAWTWEHLALTRARVISGPPRLREAVETAIANALTTPRDPAKLAQDVRDMRERIASEKATKNIWDVKQVRGGLIDLEFIAQFLQLRHGPAHPNVFAQNTFTALGRLEAQGLLSGEHASVLLPAARLFHNLTHVLRLCLDDQFDPERAPDGLKDLLARIADAPNFGRLEQMLQVALSDTAAAFDEIVR